MTETHYRLTADFEVVRDGRRVTLPAGTPFEPSAGQLENMPDRFRLVPGPAPKSEGAPSSTGPAPKKAETETTDSTPQPGEAAAKQIRQAELASALKSLTNAEQLAEFVATMDDPVDLQLLRDAEEQGGGRVTWVREISKRIDALTPGDGEQE